MLKKLSVHIRGFEKDAIKAPLFIGIEAVCELFLPLLMAGIIDDGINGDGGMAYIWKAGLGMLALSVLSLYCGMTAAKSSAVASQGLGRNLRGEMFSKIQDFSFADIDRFSSASLITRLTNDVNTIQLTTMMCLRMLVRAPVQLISALVVCPVMNARLTLVIVVVIPVMCLLLWLIMRSCEKLFTRFQEKIDGLNNTVQENLIGIRVVKAFVRANHERAKFKKSNDELRDAGRKPAGQVPVCQARPLLAVSRSPLREPVARQIDYIQLLIDKIEIQRDCLSGGTGDAREALSVRYLIEKAALSDVRASGERYLRDPVPRYLL